MKKVISVMLFLALVVVGCGKTEKITKKPLKK